MQDKQARAEIHYKSGRQETIYGKVNKDGTPHALFTKRVTQFRAFPTVVKVDVTVQ